MKLPPSSAISAARASRSSSARRLAGRPDLFQQGAGLGRRARHAVGQLVIGIAFIAQQPRPLGAQRQGLGDDRPIVVGVGIVAARDPGLEQLLAQSAVGGELQKRLDAGARQGDGDRARPGRVPWPWRPRHRGQSPASPPIWPSLSGRTKSCSSASTFWENSVPRVARRWPIFVQPRPAPRLAAWRPGARNPGDSVPAPAAACASSPSACAPGVKRIDAREQIGIQINRAPMRRQARRHLQLDRLQRIIGVGRGEVGKHRFHPRQQLAAFFQRR